MCMGAHMHGCLEQHVLTVRRTTRPRQLSLQHPKDQVQAVRLARQHLDEPSPLLVFAFPFSQSQAVSSVERTLLARAQRTLQRHLHPRRFCVDLQGSKLVVNGRGLRVLTLKDTNCCFSLLHSRDNIFPFLNNLSHSPNCHPSNSLSLSLSV